MLNEKQAAELLGLSVKTLQNWRYTGLNGPHFHKIGRCVRYHRDELDRFLAETRRMSTSDDGRAAAAH